MSWLLAQQGSQIWAPGAGAPVPPPPAEPVAAVAAPAAGGTQPIEQQFWDQVSQLNYLEAALLIGIGLVYLLYGWKIFKILVLVNATLLGVFAGQWLGAQFELGWWPMPAAGLVLAVIAWPLMRYAVCVMGGLAGAVLGAMVWRSLMLPQHVIWAGSLVGLVALGLMAFIVFRAIVVGFTSLQGSLMTVAGFLGAAVHVKEVADPLSKGLLDRPYMLPVLVFIPALIGFVYQFSRKEENEKEKKK